MKWKNEVLGLVAMLGLLGGVSFSHLAWGGVPLPQLLHRNLFVLMGGRLAAQAPSDHPDPLVSMLGQQNEQLHELLALRSRLTGQARAATVVRREPETWWSQLEVEFVIAPGEQAPTTTAIVLTPQGLIGTLESERISIVSQQGQTFCRGTVQLLSSAETQLSVVAGEGQAPFLLEGRGGADFALRPVTSGAEKMIAPGDNVQTSGLGKLYSKGLQVAVVAKDVHWADFSSCAATPSEVMLWWK